MKVRLRVRGRLIQLHLRKQHSSRDQGMYDERVTDPVHSSHDRKETITVCTLINTAFTVPLSGSIREALLCEADGV
jgi:hypothetical protein